MGPPSLGTRLSETSASLARANKKSACPLYFSQALNRRKRVNQLDARKRSEANEADQFLPIVAKAFEEIHNLAVEIVVRFNRGWGTVDEHGSRTAKDFAIVLEAGRQQRKDEVEMRELSTVIAEGDHFASPFAGPWDKAPRRRNLVFHRRIALSLGSVAVLLGRQQRKDEVEMRELSTVIAEGDHFASPFAGPWDKAP